MLLAAQVPAAAQGTGATRPYRALFGGSTAHPDVHHTFDVSASLLAGYDDNGLSQSDRCPACRRCCRRVDISAFRPGWPTGGKAKRPGGRQCDHHSRYFQRRLRFVGTSHAASIGVAAQIGQRGRLFANQSISYAPSYLYSLFPVLSVSPRALRLAAAIFRSGMSKSSSTTRLRAPNIRSRGVDRSRRWRATDTAISAMGVKGPLRRCVRMRSAAASARGCPATRRSVWVMSIARASMDSRWPTPRSVSMTSMSAWTTDGRCR